VRKYTVKGKLGSTLMGNEIVNFGTFDINNLYFSIFGQGSIHYTGKELESVTGVGHVQKLKIRKCRGEENS
jgi:hypothetical protein